MSMVIKAGQVGRIMPGLSHVDLADHLSEARAVVDRARREAEAMLAAAAVRAAELEASERARGYAAGHATGLEEGRAAGRSEAFEEATRRFTEKHGSLAAAVTTMLAEVESIKRDLRVEGERHLLEFATALACKLTFEIGRLNREAATGNLERAIRAVGLKSDIVVYVHPDDLETAQTFAGSVLSRASDAPDIRIVAEPGLAPGGCRVTSGRCEVDSSLETQTAQLVSVLLGDAFRDGQRAE